MRTLHSHCILSMLLKESPSLKVQFTEPMAPSFDFADSLHQVNGLEFFSCNVFFRAVLCAAKEPALGQRPRTMSSASQEGIKRQVSI